MTDCCGEVVGIGVREGGMSEADRVASAVAVICPAVGTGLPQAVNAKTIIPQAAMSPLGIRCVIGINRSKEWFADGSANWEPADSKPLS